MEPDCDCEPMLLEALLPACPAVPDWLVAPACEPMADWSGWLAEGPAALGLDVAWPLTPPVAAAPVCDCALAALCSGGVVVEGGGVFVPPGGSVGLDWLVALLCELMLP